MHVWAPAWIWGTLKLEDPDHRFSGPYHLVWPRDLYRVATALQPAGDHAGAHRMVDYLWRVQKPDGSFWQNTFVTGKEKWTGDQLDEDCCRSCSPGGSAAVAPPTGRT